MSKLKLSKNIKMIISDFDGVFTDGKLFISEDFKLTKRMSFRDIMGVSVAIKNGLKVGIISGDATSAIDLLVQKFNLEDVHQDIRKKLPIVEDIQKKYGLKEDEIVYIGDDVNDIEVFNHIKYSVCPKDAHKSVLKMKNIQHSDICGGDGVFRDVVDTILELKDA